MKKADFLARTAFALSLLSFACVSRPSEAQAAGEVGQGDVAASPASRKSGITWDTVKDSQTVEIIGTVRRVGSDPFSRLVITDADGHDWSLDKDAQKTLAMRETQEVRVSAVVKLKSQRLANGKRLSDKRELTRVKLLD